MDFLEETCKERFTTEKLNIIIGFYIFETVHVQNFSLNKLTQATRKGYFRSKKEKKENHHWILHIWISLDSKV